MRRIGQALILAVLATAAWFSWHAPAPPPATNTVILPLPESPVNPASDPASGRPGAEAGQIQQPRPRLWRVVTRRIVWAAAAEALETRLKEAGLDPIKLVRDEPVIMHAFDDATMFDTREKAEAASKQWQERHIDTTIIPTEIDGKTLYMIGLGRFYLSEYAEQMQHRLKQSGRPYHYERRTVTIPVYRFSFPPRPKREAERLWRRLQDMGVATPVLLPEAEFQKLYHRKPAA